MTLHTGPGCQIGQDTTQFSGTLNSDNCDIAAEDQPKNTGCSIEDSSTKSYGAGLNAIGGGVYATQWTSDAISVYFFPRDSIPADVLGDSPDPSGWGKPAAKFAGACDIEETFKQQQIVFDTTFCGQWAGTVWDSGSCGKKAATCEEWVQNNPEAFTEAYWTINALKVYQDNGAAPAPEPSAAPSQSTIISVPLPVSTINISVPLPVSTINSSFPTIAPPVSSGLALPTSILSPSVPVLIPSASDGVFAPVPTTQIVPDIPAAPTTTPLPSNDTSVGIPSQAPTQTQSALTSRRPTQPLASQPAAPTGANGMAGFRWPLAAGGHPDNSSPSTTAASAPEGTNVPAQNSTGAVIAPSTAQNIAIPTAAPVEEAPAPAPTKPNDASLAIPIVPVVTDTVEAVHTVYETVYATVTAEPEATPVPAAKKARMARHIRDHRQRMTRHNARS